MNSTTVAHALRLMLAAGIGMAAAGCGETARLPLAAGIGPQPTLPAPATTIVPTVDVATARGWPAGAMPKAAPTLQVTAFADKFDHPRWLHVLPNGDVLVAETNRPPRGENAPRSLKQTVMGWFMKKAGAGTPSADRITLLRDADGDGIAEMRTVFAEKLFSPFGMALAGGFLYVANADGVVRFPYRDGDTRARQTTRSGRTPRRSGWRSVRRGRRCRLPSARARSSVSTARGTVDRPAATA